MPSPQVHVFQSDNLGPGFGALLFEEVQRCLQERSRCSIALPGGSAAERLFPTMAGLPLDWSRVHFYWGDERAVPADDESSNYRKARELLLDLILAPPANVHRMRGEAAGMAAAGLDDAALEYERTLRETLGEPPVLDVALLGVGPDGHVCSLFPGHPLLGERKRFVAPVSDSPKPPACRLTLTLPALFSARLVVVAAFGAAKAELIASAVRAESSAPVTSVLHRGGRTWLVLDEEAANHS